MKEEDAERYLKRVPEDQAFKLHKGTTIRDMKELAELLDIMSPESFEHHVNGEKNDFANWIRDAVGDKEFADKVQGIDDRKKLLNRIRDHIHDLEMTKVEGGIPTRNYLKSGVVDFGIGITLGFFIGLIVAYVV